MKVVFKGLMEEAMGGCSACGQRRKTHSVLVSSKHYFLPSGAEKTFYLNKPEEVTDSDGEWLLTYICHDTNGDRKVFDRVYD